MTEVTTVYDRFTALAKRAMVAARDAAASIGHDFIGTEHLLIGLAQTAGTAGEALRAQGVELDRLRAEVERQMATRGIAATHGAAATDALATLGLDVAEIRRRAEASFGTGSFQFPRPAFSLTAKQAVKTSLEYARELRQERIDSEHLLLGVLADASDTTLQVLAALSVDVAALRRAVLSRPAED
jgi:ATP-dependent Clp protease ATP-binding subunit ClpC